METSRLGILMKFFPKRKEQTLQDFKAEMDQLSPEEKIELSDQALKALQAEGMDITLKA
jgi:hypothetical protein